MTSYSIDAQKPGRLARIGHIVLHEFHDIWPPTLFFFIGFNLILFTKRLILSAYLIQFTGLAIATVSALIVGKAVLVADLMPFLRRFDGAPLAQPILFKTVVYSLFVVVARLLEAFIRYLVAGGAVGRGGYIEQQLGSFSWDQFIATQMWIVVLFLIYVTASEINRLLGDGELFKIFFTRRSSELQSIRRVRIRLLSQLARLTEAHPIAVLQDPSSAPHAKLARILLSLAQQGEAIRRLPTASIKDGSTGRSSRNSVE
jgi:hypothetical protein